MTLALRLLLIEDCEDDALLICRALRRAGIDMQSHCVQDAVGLTAALTESWDAVISDFSLPGFSGMEALRLCRASDAQVPFILMSGTVGEAAAVAAMKAGANDYVMKDNMARLAPALLRELQDAATRAELHRTELKLIESERRFHAFMDASPIIASIRDGSGCTVYGNRVWNDTVGHAADIPVARMASDQVVLASGLTTESIEEIRRPGTAPTYWKNICFPFIGAAGQPLIGEFSTDITTLKQSEETIRKLAYLDALTGLPNRRLMIDRLTHAMASCARRGIYGALLLINLDNFKLLNDEHGHVAGDLVVQQTGRRISDCVREQDTVARMGGDEFVVILEGLGRIAVEVAVDVDAIGREILEAIAQPFVLDAMSHNLTASIGIAFFHDQQHSPDELIKRADLALGNVKTAGRNNQLFFDPAMQARITLRNTLEADLREGLAKNWFALYYQPQVDSEGLLTGVEALMRLAHPVKGLMMPNSFITLAEETGLIVDLGYWALDTACQQLKAWAQNRATARLTLSVNLSARQFGDDDFVARVLALVSATGIDPSLLLLELTESLLLDEIELTIEKMTILREAGLRFSLDDFGTGYSSLSYLKRLPLHEVKIDRSFVRDLLGHANDAVIVSAILAMGHSFHLSVIAEGVETVAQRDFLIQHGCRRFQGYLFGRPVPVEMLELGNTLAA
ncbi:MAG: diguanylate cyclase (GGDEF)-like protein [Bradyrhizobium sp.]|jgi:diguanylate cyclase (GGDEF)-like protein